MLCYMSLNVYLLSVFDVNCLRLFVVFNSLVFVWCGLFAYFAL